MYFFTEELASLNDNNSLLVFPMGRINKNGETQKDNQGYGPYLKYI